jgi:hypothetical protein
MWVQSKTAVQKTSTAVSYGLLLVDAPGRLRQGRKIICSMEPLAAWLVLFPDLLIYIFNCNYNYTRKFSDKQL